MSDYWKLNGHTVVPATDVMDWASSFENGKRHVAQTVLGDVWVSTVFLGIDHSHGFGPPQFFESMVFGGPFDQEQLRYTTWDEAERGHEKLLAMVTTAPSPE